MRLDEFQDAADRYGGDLARWPEAERRLADALLRQSPEAQAILDAATQLRAAFSEAAPVRAPAGLADRIILRALETTPAPAVHPAASRRWRHAADSLRQMAWLAHARPAFLLSLCFVLGFASSQWRSLADRAVPTTDLTSLYADLAP